MDRFVFPDRGYRDHLGVKGHPEEAGGHSDAFVPGGLCDVLYWVYQLLWADAVFHPPLHADVHVCDVCVSVYAAHPVFLSERAKRGEQTTGESGDLSGFSGRTCGPGGGNPNPAWLSEAAV